MKASEFLETLPPERRRVLKRVRQVVRRRLPKGYEEAVVKNMVVYQVPLSVYRDTYNGQALWYVALASQKAYLALHLMPVYADRQLEKQLREGFRAAGKKLDMGKACIRFKAAEDLALDVVGEIVAAIPAQRWIEIARGRWQR